jgi:hypothetical protein
MIAAAFFRADFGGIPAFWIQQSGFLGSVAVLSGELPQIVDELQYWPPV